MKRLIYCLVMLVLAATVAPQAAGETKPTILPEHCAALMLDLWNRQVVSVETVDSVAASMRLTLLERETYTEQGESLDDCLEHVVSHYGKHCTVNHFTVNDDGEDIDMVEYLHDDDFSAVILVVATAGPMYGDSKACDFLAGDDHDGRVSMGFADRYVRDAVLAALVEQAALEEADGEGYASVDDDGEYDWGTVVTTADDETIYWVSIMSFL